MSNSRTAPKKISALVFDLDGTAIPKDPQGHPSTAVITAVQQAKQFCHVSVATGRPLALTQYLLEELKIDDLCILNGGTQLYSHMARKSVWEQEVDQLTLQELFTHLRIYSRYEVANEKRLQRVPIAEYACDMPIGLTCIFSTQGQDTTEMLAIVKKFPGITAHAVSSWKEGTFDIHITHELATKKHALQALLGYLNVHMDETMVVGDGGNDLPLFELAGWRVAMGNAAPELKEQADWIAPSVDEDGLAVAIERFVLKG
jgi:HAD superfamily hydrolase (TIGR01484 family)